MPKNTTGLHTQITLPSKVADALEVKGQISYSEIPRVIQKQIDQNKRKSGDRKIPLDAISESLTKLLDIKEPLNDMELTRLFWQKMKELQAPKDKAAPLASHT